MSSAEDVWEAFKKGTFGAKEEKREEKKEEVTEVREVKEPVKEEAVNKPQDFIPPPAPEPTPSTPTPTEFIRPTPQIQVEDKTQEVTMPQKISEFVAPKPVLEQIKPEEEFDISPASEEGGVGIMIYGDKGEGKTALAFSLPGKIACISLDQQSRIVWQEIYKKDPRIQVWDGIRYYSELSPELLLESSDKTLRYLNFLLDTAIKDFQPDWVMIDGTEILSRICEMTMRNRNNKMPFEGIANRNLWKERNMYMNQIHHKAMNVAKQGVVYTSYIKQKEINEGGVERKIDRPKWAGDIELKTRVLIKVESETIKEGRNFYAIVESSKISFIPTSGRKIIGTVDNEGNVKNYGFSVLIRR